MPKLISDELYRQMVETIRTVRALQGRLPAERPRRRTVVPPHVRFGKPKAAFTSGSTLAISITDKNGDTPHCTQNDVTIAFDAAGTSVAKPLATDDVVAFVPIPETSDGVTGVFLGVWAGTHADETDLYATFEGLEAAQTDTWDITSQGANDGVTVPVTTRVVYSDTGDETVYGFYRILTFDSSGRLVAVSAETRYTIDAAEDC